MRATETMPKSAARACLAFAVGLAGCTILPPGNLADLAGNGQATIGVSVGSNSGSQANGGLTNSAPGKPIDPASLIGNNSGSLVSNNAASLAGDVLAPAGLVANNSNALISDNASKFQVSALSTVPLQRALIYLSDTRERLFLDPSTGAVIATTTDEDGKFRFEKAPSGDSVVVNAVLSGNRRMVGFAITRPGENQVQLNIGSTLVTEFLRSRALLAPEPRTLGSYDPELKAVPGLVRLTSAGLEADRIGLPDLTVGRIPAMNGRYLTELATRVPDLKKAWETLLGTRLTVIETVAGTRTGFGGDGGPARAANLMNPSALALAADGGILVADTGNGRIRRIGPDGTIATVVGGGDPAALAARIAAGEELSPVGDGAKATEAVLQEPRGVMPGPFGTLVVTEFAGMRVRVVLPDGRIATIMQGQFKPGSSDGPLLGSPPPSVHVPSHLVMGPDGAIYLADSGNHVVRRLAVPNPVDLSSAVISRFAGTYKFRHLDVLAADGTPAPDAPLANPLGMCFDQDDNLYVSELFSHHVVRIGADGKLYNFAGNGTGSVSGDGGPALQAGLPFPSALACDDDRHRILIGSWQSPRIRSVDLGTGRISTLAGGGTSSEDGLALDAALSDIGGMALEPGGNLLFTDSQSGRVRRLWLAD